MPDGLVAFNNMPGTLYAPLFYAEINPGTPPYAGRSRSLLIGRKLTGGSAVSGVPVNIGASDPIGLFGAGSMLADMAVFARWHNPVGEIWALPVADPGGAVAATGTITITGPATQGGTYTRYVAGEPYSVAVAVGDTATTVGAALAAAINAGYSKFNRKMLAPVTAANVSGVVTLTARHPGVEGNGIRIETNLAGNDMDPAGITDVIVAMASGSGAVDIAAALANLGTLQVDWVAAGPYSTSTQLNAAQTFFSDSGSGRWSPTVSLDGHYICCNDGNLSAQTTLGGARNDRHASILATHNYPHPLWSWSAALVGVIGLSKDLGRSLTEAVEIARPLQTLVLSGLRPPKSYADRWALADRQTLYPNGMSAVVFARDGTASIDRIVTSYLTNAYGSTDITFMPIETMAISAYVKRYIRQVVTSTYPRHVLRDDNPRGLQGVVTPDQARATMIHAYTQLSEVAGIVEKPTLFAKYVIAQRSSDPNRLNAYLPIDVANQLNVFAANITVYPEYPPGGPSGL